MLTRDMVLVPAERVAVAFVGDEAVLLSERDGIYYSLNAVGTCIWRSCGAGKTVGQIGALLSEEFDVAEDAMWRDLRQVCEELLRFGLLTIRDQELPEPSARP